MNTDDTKKTTVNDIKKRNPWTAVLLSLFLPGLGHVYCGSIVNGIVIIAIISWLPFLWMVATIKGQQVIIPLTVMFGSVVALATIAATIDSYRLARRTRHDYKLKAYNSGAIYAVLMMLALGGTTGFAFTLKDKVIEAFSIPSHSMSPTILHGDRAIASKLAYKTANPERGDIVLFKNPDNRKQNYIKRVVASAGDTVELKGSELFINGEKLQRQFIEEFELEQKGKIVKGKSYYEHNAGIRYKILITEPKDSDAPKDFRPVTVPKYSCFVLGDNRNMSRDSRDFGSLQTAALRGRFEYLYYTTGDKSRLGNINK
jgi:signal peptidase I